MESGLGSHLAGAIAANGRVYGVGPNLGIRAYKVLSDSGFGAFEWIAGEMTVVAHAPKVGA